MNDKDLIGLLLPKGLQEYFDITELEKNSDSYIIHLEEKNIPPSQYKDNTLHSKGFYEAITIQDFPLRGKACFLKVKRRKWINIDTGHIVCRDWNIVARGTRMTSDFAAFLKAINR